MSKTLDSVSAGNGQAGFNLTIERAKQELEDMIDLNPQIMLLVDRNGTVVRTNKALLELLSLSDFSAALGKTLDELFRCDGEQISTALIDSDKRSAAHNAAVMLPDGANRDLTFKIIKSGKQADTYVVIVFDITSERRDAAHLEKKHKKEAVEALMGSLMHNINQPLTVILVRTQLMHLALQKGTMSIDEQRKNLEDIMRLTNQIADLLKTIRKPKDYVTTDYVNDVQILDIQQSGSRPEEPEASCNAVLDALMLAMDTHEPGSMLHARRVGEYVVMLCKQMGLNNHQAEVVKRCALLHDIGKIGVPDNILQKPERLTNEEMKIMMGHAEIGYNLLCDVPFLAHEAEVARANHEHFDGTGYPRGLRGEEIPLEARIVAVADAFDAMRSDRIYRNAVTVEDAVSEIEKGAGTQFDPTIVEAFSSTYTEMDALFRQEKEKVAG